ncbi:MAG: hypothetical protein K9L76_00165 [Candidatus Omnitrophica bacterium]|nr:hypothetical protein [Candidatus Omnitrophota bacterium]
MEEEYREQERKDIINQFKASQIKVESAVEILDFLPIRKRVAEDGYIKYLWDSFLTLDAFGGDGRSFNIMPFHLLFMLALQFKALRLAKLFSQAANLFFAGVGGRDKAKLLNPERSVFDFALINERTLPEIFRLVNMPGQAIGSIKSLIDDRNNNLAHAKGGSETDPEGKIDQYLNELKGVQTHFSEANDHIAEQWITEIIDEEVLSDFVELRLLDSQLCPADFKNGLLIVFNSDDELPLNIWRDSATKVLEKYSQQGALWLNHVAENHFDKEVKNLLKEIVKQ